MQLQARLVAQRFERVRRDLIDPGIRRVSRSFASVSHAGRPQPRDVLAPDAGDQHQVILPLPALLAHPAELAQPAVLDAVRLGRRSLTDRGEEAGADAPVVGVEVGGTQRPSLADAEQDVHRLHRRSWMAAIASE